MENRNEYPKNALCSSTERFEHFRNFIIALALGEFSFWVNGAGHRFTIIDCSQYALTTPSALSIHNKYVYNIYSFYRNLAARQIHRIGKVETGEQHSELAGKEMPKSRLKNFREVYDKEFPKYFRSFNRKDDEEAISETTNGIVLTNSAVVCFLTAESKYFSFRKFSVLIFGRISTIVSFVARKQTDVRLSREYSHFTIRNFN